MRSHSATRTTIAAAAMAGIAIMAAGCGPMQSGPPSAADAADIEAALEEGAQLTVWSGDPRVRSDARRFEATYPAVEIEVLGPGDMYGPDAGLELTVEIGEHIPDVVQMWTPSDAADYVRSGLLTDLTRFGADDLESSFVAAAWDGVAFADGVWGLPVHADPALVAYRADVLENAGIDEFPATWDEFAEAAAMVKEQTGFYLTALGSLEIELLLRQDAPRLVDWDGGDDVLVDIVNPSTLRATDYWDELVDEHLVLRSIMPDPFATLSRGDVASLIGTSVALEGLEYAPQSFGAAGEKWRIAPLPQWDASTPSSVGRIDELWGIPAGSEHPLVAYGFISWLTGERVADAADDRFSSAPASIEALSNTDWLDAAPAFFGGQQVHRLFADAAREMTFSGHDPEQFWTWFSVGPESRATSLSDALRAWQTTCIDVYENEGYAVSTGVKAENAD